MKLENIQILDEYYNPELSNIDNVNVLLKKGIWNYAIRHSQDLVSHYVRFHLADRESRKQIAKEKVLQELKIELPDSLIATKEDYCLPSHLKNNKYNHGFAHVQLDNEQFEVRNYKIINNKIY